MEQRPVLELQWVDVATFTQKESNEVGHVVYTALKDIVGVEIDVSLDHDVQEPQRYYSHNVGGAFLVVRNHATAEIVGTAALRRLDDLPLTVELKRMYMLPSCRGLGIGHGMMRMLIAKAKELGYRRIVLDTRTKLTAANHLYENYGFTECERYNANPRPDRFMSLTL